MDNVNTTAKEKQKEMPWRVRYSAYLIAGLLIVSGLCILIGLNQFAFLHDSNLAKEVAHALIIAGLLAIFVDRFVKAHFIREVTRDVYHYLVGYDLPDEIKDQIKDLTQTKLVRPFYHFDCRFTQNGENFLKGEITIEYDIENYSTYPENFKPALAVENSDNPLFISHTVTEHPQAYSMENFEVREPEKGVKQIDGNEIRLRPRGEKERCHVRFEYTILVPCTYSDVLHLSYPTQSLRITAKVPDGYIFTVSGSEPIGNCWEIRPPKQSIRIRLLSSSTSHHDGKIS